MKDIANHYTSIRERALKRQQARKKAVLRVAPQYRDLEREYVRIQGFIGVADGHDQKEALQAKLQDLKIKMEDILTAEGFSKDFLCLEHQCEICKDYGFVNGKPCICYEKKRFHIKEERSNLLGFEQQTFESFDLSIFPQEDGQRARMGQLHQHCRQYADEFPDVCPENILLIGSSGLGKTYLMHCIGRRVLDHGFSVRKVTANQFQRMLMEQVIGQRDERPLVELENVDMLLYDDLGSEPSVKGIGEHYFFALLNERQTAHKPMVVASNCSIEEIRQRYGERTISRLLDTKLTRAYSLKGKDLRLFRR